MVCKKKLSYPKCLLITRLETLRANGIIPRNPEPLDTLPPPETSSGKGEHSKVKEEEEVKSELDSESDDEDTIREKALLVR